MKLVQLEKFKSVEQSSIVRLELEQVSDALGGKWGLRLYTTSGIMTLGSDSDRDSVSLLYPYYMKLISTDCDSTLVALNVDLEKAVNDRVLKFADTCKNDKGLLDIDKRLDALSTGTASNDSKGRLTLERFNLKSKLRDSAESDIKFLLMFKK